MHKSFELVVQNLAMKVPKFLEHDENAYDEFSERII